MGLFKKKPKIELVPSFVAVDIGTENVKVAYCIQENDDIHVVGYARVKQKPYSMNSAQIVKSSEVVDTVDKALGQALAMAEEHVEHLAIPEKAYVGIAGELVQGVSIMANVDRDDPAQKITLHEVEHVVQQVKNHTFSSAQDEIARDLGLDPQHVIEIETILNTIAIDGKRIENPLGLTGSEFTCRVFTAFAPRIHYQSVTRILNELKLGVERVIVEPYALAIGIQGMTSPTESAVIIDIGGGTTDIALIKEGELIGTRMYAIGGQAFTKRLAHDFGLSYEEAEALKLDYGLDRPTRFPKQDISRSLSTDVRTWVEGITIALEELEDKEEFPPNFYVCGGGGLLPDIREMLIEYPWMQELNLKKHPKIEFLLPNKIDHVVDKTRKATEIMDVTVLALARMHLN